MAFSKKDKNLQQMKGYTATRFLRECRKKQEAKLSLG